MKRSPNDDPDRLPSTPYQAAADDYRTRLGWAVHTHDTAVWITPATPVEAFNVPRPIGHRTLTSLRAGDVTLPVINIPGPPDRWALLVQPHSGSPSDILELLTSHDVGYAYRGHHQGRTSDWSIDLPPTRHPGHAALSWITPTDTPLPTALTVAQALVTVLTNSADG